MAELEIRPEDNGYRLIGLLPNRQLALTFTDYLTGLGLKALTRPSLSEAWEIYVKDDLSLTRAQRELYAFAQDPLNPKYRQASWQKGASVKSEKVLGRRVPLSFSLKSPLSLIELACALLYLASLLLHLDLWQGVLLTLSLTSFADVTEGFELWRLFTPILLHFGLMHVAFNLVMFEAMGRAMERYMGAKRTLLIVLVIALVSNLSQFLFSAYFGQYALFGGLSGVVYGLIGYRGALSMRADLPAGLKLPPGLLTVCAVFVLLGFFLSGVANFCHVGGIVIGVLWGLYDRGRLVVHRIRR